MITFIDGPAAGQTMNLRRTPPMLRVVRSRTTGQFDGLDQLADEPTDDEEIFVYRIEGEPMRAFVDYTEGDVYLSSEVVVQTAGHWPTKDQFEEASRALKSAPWTLKPIWPEWVGIRVDETARGIAAARRVFRMRTERRKKP